VNGAQGPACIEERLLEPSGSTLIKPIAKDNAVAIRMPRQNTFPMQQRGPSSVAFVVMELGLLAAAAFFGGPAWTGMTVLACLAEVGAGSQLWGLLTFVPAFGWLAAAVLTENRELFFPFAMAVAAFLAGRLRVRSTMAATVAGTGGVIIFLAIRIAQQATVGVLMVEAAVAGLILGFILAGARWLPKTAGVLAGMMAIASLLAYLGLAL
jgi:hypothetical protein